MNFSTKIVAVSLLLKLSGWELTAQTTASFGNLPLWFEAGPTQEFIARGSHSTLTIKPGAAEFQLQKADGQAARCTMQLTGASPALRMIGTQPLEGKINRLLGSQPIQWQTGVPTFGQVLQEGVYPGVDVVFYGNQKTLEYDFHLAAGAKVADIALHFAGAKTLSTNPQGDLVIKINGGEIVQHAPVAYQTIDGIRREVVSRYRILDQQTVGFSVGRYDAAQPLVIDPVLSYSTFFGGNYGDIAWAIGVNTNDNSIYVAGQTFSYKITNDVPLTTPGALQTNYHGGKFTGDAFIARIDSTGTNLIYATYLGGIDNDGVLGLAVDGSGNAFLTGFTDSRDFPTTTNALYPTIRSLKDPNYKIPATDAFVTKLNPTGDAMIYSTYLGGNSMDAAFGIALDGDGNAYVTGYTYSTNFPVTPDAFQSKLACSNTVYLNANAFVTMIKAGGAELGYSTFLGGTNYDVGRSIAYNNGRVFVAGYTLSTNFPSINNLPGFTNLDGTIYDKKKKKKYWHTDAFVAAFDAPSANLSLLYSSYLGGTNADAAYGIAGDAAGNAYVVGYTMSTNFPCTATNVPNLTASFVHTNDFKKHHADATNGFLTQITFTGGQAGIGFSAMFGGRGVNLANGVTLDQAGNIYVVGFSGCTNFPTTPDNIAWPLSATNSSKKKNKLPLSDAFIMTFNPDCTELLYSALLGGREHDYGNAIAVDPTGTAYIAGQTLSEDFPTVNPLQAGRTGTNDMFIARISPDALPELTLTQPKVSSSIQAKAAIPSFHRPGKVSLKWKTFPPGYDVESSDDIGGSGWQPLPIAPSATNGWYQLDLPATNQFQFFRLRRH
jgi:hypothetical protein